MNPIEHRIHQSLEIGFDEAIKIRELALQLSYLPFDEQLYQEAVTDDVWKTLMRYKALWELKLKTYCPTDANEVLSIMRFHNNRAYSNKKVPSGVQEVINGCFILLDLPSGGHFVYRYTPSANTLDLLYADAVGFTGFIQDIATAIRVRDRFIAILNK